VFFSAVKKHLYGGKIKLIAFLIDLFPGGKCGLCVRMKILPPSCDVMKSGSLNFLKLSGPLQACNGTALSVPFLIAFCISILGVSELSVQRHNLTILYEKKQLVDWSSITLSLTYASKSALEPPELLIQ
jgi:hypothetical protein